MSNSINPLTLRNVVNNSAREIASRWKAGQLLQAIFLRKNNDGYSVLKVGGALLKIRLDQSPRSGEKLLLEVMKADSKPVVRVYPNITPSRATQIFVADAIKQSIAKQNSVALLLNTIQTIQRESPQYSSIPTAVRRLMKKLLSQAMPAKQLSSANGVKSALQNSGILLEQRLLKFQRTSLGNNSSIFQKAINQDLKATLLRLKQQLSITSPVPKLNKRKTSLAEYSNISGKYNNHVSINKLFALNNSKLVDIADTDTLNAKPLFSHSRPKNLSLFNGRSFHGYPIERINMLNIKPLLRNSIPHPAGSNNNSLNITADRIATGTQSLTIQLLKMVDAALARINIAQLSSAPVDTDNKQVWLFDIPVTNNKEHELVQAKIDVDKEDSNEQQTRVWTVQLAMNVNSLGPLQSTITICDNKVQAHFNSNSPAQQKLIEENIEILRRNLVKAGMFVEKIICTQGLKEDVEQDRPQPLLDEEV